MSAYYFSIHMIVAAHADLALPIKKWMRLRTIMADLANEENQ